MPETYPYDPDYVVHPGAVLQEWFDDNRLSHKIATKLYGLTEEELTGVLDGSMPITPELAGKLLNLTHISVAFWLAMDHNFRVGLAAGKHWIRDES
jgi:plasmid maintenance system antidote protein VapI